MVHAYPDSFRNTLVFYVDMWNWQSTLSCAVNNRSSKPSDLQAGHGDCDFSDSRNYWQHLNDN